MTYSAGILVYKNPKQLEVLLVHPGGPFFAKKDLGVWSIPKGEVEEGEDQLEAAKREFSEELNMAPPSGELIDLGTIRQAGGKVVSAWAVKGDIDVTKVKCNTFAMEWPPKSGKQQEFPENDKTEWLRTLASALNIEFTEEEIVKEASQQSLL
jgi:predicted NUDIX family NTP pyrophosphohydrolase